MKKRADFIIAHRGESYDAPENTIASINLAWERGAKAVEIDIQMTIDCEIVVIHDKNSLRISGVKKEIRKATLKDLLLLNAGSHKGEKWKTARIPTLQEVLKTVPEHGRIIIEIKSNHHILPKLKEELFQSGLKKDQIEIIAFNFKTLVKAKQMMPEYRMFWLLDLDYSRPGWLFRPKTGKIIKKITDYNLQGIDAWAGKLLTEDFIRSFKKAGLLVYAWTVNDSDEAHSLIKYGVDGITTDRAGWMIVELDNFQE